MTHWQSTKQMVASVFGSRVLKLKPQSSLTVILAFLLAAERTQGWKLEAGETCLLQGYDLALKVLDVGRKMVLCSDGGWFLSL